MYFLYVNDSFSKNGPKLKTQKNCSILLSYVKFLYKIIIGDVQIEKLIINIFVR